MREITQQQILSMAPNPSAVNNARKISSGNGFVSRSHSQDDTFYMGECKGSGKSNYIVSADFAEEEKPVFRCTCPSRQFPCKHSLALLFEMEAKKEFAICEIPESILEKRAKKEARELKKAEESVQPPKEKKINKSARTKKIKRQLEGLTMLEKMVSDLLNGGLGTMGGVSLKTYRDLAKQLGDYYLPGPLNLMNQLILEIGEYQKDADSGHYENAVGILIRLRSLTKKANVYLQEKLDSGNLEDDDSILYEELGGIWTLERLNQLGLAKENSRLVQLSFETYYDEARKEWIDQGYFADADSGEVHTACNYRPVKALKYIKEEDSMFDMVQVPLLTYYPGDINKRIRWEKSTLVPVDQAVRRSVMQKAHTDLTAVIKLVKNQIKNTLSNDFAAVMVSFRKIGILKNQEGDCCVLEDHAGNRIVLRDRKGHEETVTPMLSLRASALFEEQVLFGAIYYDFTDHQICMQPYSIVTENGIVRLLY
ncbi:MAG: SWIM zinc finger family protein [Lachnospiraceae bacterium]